MIATVARVAWLQLRRRKLLWICAAITFLPALASAVLLIEGNGGRDLYDNVIQIYFHFLIPFVPTLLLGPAVSDEVDNKTHTFLFARPMPRYQLVLGKYLTATAAAAAMMTAALALAWGLAMIRLSSDFAPELLHFLRTEAATILGVAAFGALAAAIGSVFVKHPLVAALIYILVIEASVGSSPLVINVVALSWHLRSVAELGQPANFGPTANVPLALSIAIIVAAPALLLSLAGLSLKDKEL